MPESNERPVSPASDGLHAAVAAIAAHPELHTDVRAALGFYESVRLQLNRAAEHVLVLAVCHPPRPRATAPERET